MIFIQFSGRTPSPSAITIGNSGEHGAEAVKFEGLPHFTGGVTHLCWQRGGVGDIETLQNDEWIVNRTVTSAGQYVYAYLEVAVGADTVWRSDQLTMKVGRLPNIEETVEQRYPTAIAQCMAEAESARASAAQASADAHNQAAASAQSAAEAAGSAEILKNIRMEIDYDDGSVYLINAETSDSPATGAQTE